MNERMTFKTWVIYNSCFRDDIDHIVLYLSPSFLIAMCSKDAYTDASSPLHTQDETILATFVCII